MFRSVFRVSVVLLSIVGLGFSAQVLARAFDRAPPPRPFTLNGQAHEWRVLHGLTGSVSFSGPIGPDGREQGLVLTCSGLTSGGVQARFYAPEPYSPQLRIRTDDVVFRVRSYPYNVGGPDFVEGQGDLPDGYLASLARTKTLSIEYAGQVTTVPGPGKALAEHFGAYCRELAQRASHDE